MKKLFMICAVIMGFTITASAQTDSKAEFKFTEEKHDFGKIPQGKPVTYEFAFVNSGTEPLIISDVKPACGCTLADFTRTPVLPGAKGTIKITFNAAVVTVFNKSIIVSSNAKTPTKYLVITGEVTAPPTATTGTN